MPQREPPVQGVWTPTPGQEFAYAMGGCADLALALQRRLHWPMVAIMEPDYEGNQLDGADNDRPAHIMLQSPEGLYLDIMGLRTLPAIKRWAGDFVDDTAVIEDWWLTPHVDAAMIRAWITDGYLDQPTTQDRQEARTIASQMVAALGLTPAAATAPPEEHDEPASSPGHGMRSR